MKKITFNLALHSGEMLSASGFSFVHDGVSLVVHHGLNPEGKEPHLDRKSGFEVSEETTGSSVIKYAKTQKEAIQSAKSRIDAIGVDVTLECIATIIKNRNDRKNFQAYF